MSVPGPRVCDDQRSDDAGRGANPPSQSGGLVLIDCERCVVRGSGCDDCVVTALLGTPRTVEIGDREQEALQALADVGMVPPLRLILPESKVS